MMKQGKVDELMSVYQVDVIMESARASEQVEETQQEFEEKEKTEKLFE